MNTLLWVLVGVLVYSLVAKALQIRGYLPDAIRLQGPIATIHTRRGRALLTRLARPKRFWRAYSNVGVGVALVIMAGMFVLLLFQALTILQNPPAPSAVNQPQNFLVVPGVNDFLPLAVAPEILFGLLIGLVVHEGGHGLLCRVENIDIESMGVVFLAFIPIGAFVEPDEESQSDANRGARTRMFAAGVTNNFVLTAVAFALLFGPVIGAVGVAPGVAVDGAYPGSPAATAGVDHGDRITAVAGTEVTSEGDLDDALLAAENRTVAVEIDGERTIRVERSLTVVGSVGSNPANLTVEDDPIRVQAVNGTAVHTRGEFRDAVADSTFARIETTAGERTIPVGAYVTRVAQDGPLANASAPTNASLIITSIGGERVTSSTDLARVLDGYDPGDRVPVRTYQDGAFETYTVTLGENPRDGNGFIGVDIFPGTSGLLITDFGVSTYPAGTYLELLGGSDGTDGGAFSGLVDSPFALVYVALVLPLASVVLGIPNFPGFTPAVTNFYVVEGPLAPLGDGVYIIANTLFWAAWVNLQLGLFNCIPGYPLDGGRILRTCTEAVVSRLPVTDSARIVRTITTSIGLTMLASLILMIFGPQLL
ncbi:site-2 protease family protein [Haloplanus aerogenes]|uniref:PDZ domain-containing protein n=1 Tax=Haloplanus aerogenes TaxID=660522 RepID=A0A3M0DRE5_9EURY|nr:site-2 protease family protein [Haloplanus aerogenes]AZH24172.1 PDZ domain-containing protein [Haloplanus aerogenes]RMB24208.1 PDZ domain-containing protein [Haloplanus aerogenes]